MTKGSTLRNVFTVGSFTMLSRVLGLAREMLQSRLIGAGVEQSAFTLAFAIPNMFRKMFGEGALTAAFVPVFKAANETDGIKEAEKLARAVFAMVFLILFAIIALGFCVSGYFSVTADSERGKLIAVLVTILLPYMLFICGAAFGMGVLNALGKFKASSFMPAFLNLVWIAALGLLAFDPALEVKYRVGFVALAILAGGFAQMGFMLVAMKRAGVDLFRRPFLPWKNERFTLVRKNLVIGIVGAGAIQANYALDQLLAQLASPWAAGVIGYAERLMDLPLGVIGVAFGTVLLPTFAGFFAKNDPDGARGAFAASVEQQMFVMIPAALGLAVTAPIVTQVIYEGGSFDALATLRVSRALAVYALGLGFFGFQKSLIPWFQAQHDMKTPLRVSVATVIVNAALNILAVWLLPVEWRHVGLAVSTVFCAALGCVIFVCVAHARGQSLGLVKTLPTLAKILFAALLMAAAVCFTDRLKAGTLRPICRLASDIAIGGLVYAFAALPLVRGRVSFRRRC